MPAPAPQPSRLLAELLRSRRRELRLSLRDVEARARQHDKSFHFTTLARIEAGKADPGARRLFTLMRIYELPAELASDLLELEELGDVGIPHETDPRKLLEEGKRLYREGDLRRALAHLFAVRVRLRVDCEPAIRQEALFILSAAAATVGKYQLSWQMIQQLSVDALDRPLRVRALVQAARCCHRLHMHEFALALVQRAEAHVAPDQPREKALVRHEEGLIRTEIEEREPARAAYAEALRLYAEAGDVQGICSTQGAICKFHLRAGEAAPALEAARASVEAAGKTTVPRLQIGSSIELGRALLANGETVEGLARLRGALGRAIEEDDRMCRFLGHFYLWKAYEELGREGEAEVELAAAKDQFRRIDFVSPETSEIARLVRLDAGGGRGWPSR